MAAYSSTHRIFTEQQRLALLARDLGCTFPDCDAPPEWRQIHHVDEFQHGGATSVSNAAMVCGGEHREFQAMGWRCVLLEDGLPAWIPPKWIDAEQRPRRNTRHRPLPWPAMS